MGSELEVQRLKRASQEVLEEPVKRQKIREASGSVEEVYVEALQVKYPIIDWEVYSKDTRRYWKIIRVGNHTKAYQIFVEMLKKFDKDDLVKLWDLLRGYSLQQSLQIIKRRNIDFRSFMMDGIDGEFHFEPKGGVGDGEGSSPSIRFVNNKALVIDDEPLNSAPPLQFAENIGDSDDAPLETDVADKSRN
ncbi:hypothetical protein Tco_0652831 [Tanacetum coccineum]|uniref:Uncharacterized protein n=1 Tax=Tanacetum coccineum TaxID=301880 RepID=A0ABQ4WYN4_9ASTR